MLVIGKLEERKGVYGHSVLCAQIFSDPITAHKKMSINPKTKQNEQHSKGWGLEKRNLYIL